jgi:translocation and assembly module TamB
VALDGADLFGLRVGPTPLVFRFRKGEPAIDPIDVAVNDGKLHAEPVLTIGEGGKTSVRLGPETTLSDAWVNDEVSHRVLSFVAPVLDNATRVRGRVSVSLEEAVFPVGRGGGSSRGFHVKGSVVFQDVAFNPGPFIDPIFGLIGREDRPSLRLDQPVDLTIADRRVYQSGFSLPIGKLTALGLEGWVDFDRNLNLTATVPVVPPALADRPLLNDIAGGVKVRVPIRGTLDKPEVDKEAFRLGMKDLGKTVLGRGAFSGAAALLERLTRPREPDAPPPPPRLTPEQRKEQRQEKRAERRRRRGNGP